MNSVEHEFRAVASYGDGSSYINDVVANVTLDIAAPDNETAGQLADEINETVKQIIKEETSEDESNVDSHTVDVIATTLQKMYGSNPQLPIEDYDAYSLLNMLENTFGEQTIAAVRDECGWDDDE